MQAERRLEELGLELPPPPKPGGNYLPALQVGTLLFLSGHGPGEGKGKLFRGRLMQDLTVEEGYASARQVALSLLSTLKETLGDLDRINRIVKLTGFVNSAPEFIDQPKVINGASDLLVDVFGEKGRHTRSAIGMVALPGGIPVEIEIIVELAE
jgi:enamine deaminase RidA (YjgF/YER057c/UK114 family)